MAGLFALEKIVCLYILCAVKFLFSMMLLFVSDLAFCHCLAFFSGFFRSREARCL